MISDEEKYRKILSKADIFWSRVDRGDPNACWLWFGAFDKDGYGFLNIKPLVVKSHRIAWILTHGMITSEQHVLHRCDNRPCCNPSHHFLGDNDINVADMVTKGRQSKGEKNSVAVRTAYQALKTRDPATYYRGRRAKLDDDRVRLIRKIDGTHEEIAAQFSVSPALVGLIRQRKRWSHVIDA